jgi:NADPH:quinone reductase-like Zn-dependent oxidoreductase
VAVAAVGDPAAASCVAPYRVFARPDASKIREFADDIRDGKFVLPVSQRMPLRDAGRAHALLQGGGGGKIVLVTG